MPCIRELFPAVGRRAFPQSSGQLGPRSANAPRRTAGACPSEQDCGWKVDPERFGTVAAPAAPAPVAWRYSKRASFGERAKWMPPHRLVPSFASADGKTAVYRRRWQVTLTESGDNNTAVAHGTTIEMGGAEYKVRIDQYGYARLIRPVRSQQHVDPLSNTV